MTDNIGSLQQLLKSTQLQCKLCNQWLSNPQLLPCLDSICEICLPKTDNECPVCECNIQEKHCHNPFIGSLVKLANLREPNENLLCDYCNFEKRSEKATMRCLDCGDNMCNECNAAHGKTKLTRSHTTLAFTDMETGKYDKLIREQEHSKCEVHTDEVISKYCVNCDKLLCRSCLENINTANEHDKHQCGSILEMGNKAKSQITQISEQLKLKLQKMEEMSSFIVDYENNLKEHAQQISRTIEDHAELLHSLIETHKANLLKQLEETVAKETTNLNDKSNKISGVESNIVKSLDFSDALLSHGRDDEILAVQSIVKRKLNHLSNAHIQAISDKLTINFLPGATPDRSINLILGKLVVNHKTGTNYPVVNGFDNSLQLMDNSFVSLNPSIGSNKQQQRSLVNGSMDLFRTSEMLPKSELILEFEAKSPLDTRDIWPTGVAISKENKDYYILDRDNKCVKVFSTDGRYKFEFGNPGSGEGSLANPYDIALMDSGLVIITDYQHEVVKCYTSSGQFKNNIRGPFKHPRGITPISQKRFAVVDCRTRHITLHEADSGQLWHTIKDQQLVDPYYICSTGQEKLAVTDWASPNIKILDFGGRLIGSSGSYGSERDQLLQPYGIVADHSGHILVADNSNHRVHLVAAEGQFIKTIVTKTDSLWHPMALGLTSDGHLVVTEALGKIKVFKYRA